MNFITDCHTHTAISPDGKGTVKELCQKASDLGLGALAVTEHCEVNRFFSSGYYNQIPRNEFELYSDGKILENAMAAIEKEKANDYNFELIAGIELGQINADFGLSDIISRDKRLDFTIASLHELIGMTDFAFIDYTSVDLNELLNEYFFELYSIAVQGEYDVLGHITYPFRYIEGEYGIEVNIDEYIYQIEEILNTVIRRNKGIELNTSGLRQKYGDFLPSAKILEKYHELGGRIITVGSDAHCAEDLASGTEEGTELLREIGFKEICYYKKHRPVFVKIS